MGKLPLIMGVLILLLSGLSLSQCQRAQKFEERAETAQLESARLLESVKSKDDVLDRYESEAKKASKIAEDALAAQRKAADNAGKLKSQLEAANRALRSKEDADRAIPDCQKILDLDLSVCPGLSDGLLERAHRGIPRSSAGSSSPNP